MESNGLDRTFTGTVKLGYSTARLINQTNVFVQDMNQIHHSQEGNMPFSAC